MRALTLTQPRHLAFGWGVRQSCPQVLADHGIRRLFLLCDPHVQGQIGDLVDGLVGAGLETALCTRVTPEPPIEALEAVLAEARAFAPDGVLGVGGGSTIDLAKLVAVLFDGQQDIQECFGIGNVRGRRIPLAAIPTTSGTGSEVTPIAVVADEAAQLKKGVVSPHLVPDFVFVDPELTLTLPPAVTAATGMDALVHCIEVYTNRHAHPMVDLYALEGVRLAGSHLERAVRDGGDRQAREAMSRASLYGGLGLGPVNTAAVHALAYPLGGEFRVPHGVTNALLLPHVVRFNQPAAPERYAQIAEALGASLSSLADHLCGLLARLGLPQTLRDVNVPPEAIPRMARAAMEVSRLLDNNPREVTLEDAEAIYRAAL